MNNYRATFYDGPNGNHHKSVDFAAKDMDDAFRKAHAMPEAKDRQYTDLGIEEVEDGPKNIGLEIECTDTALKKTFHDYLIIRANSEADAVAYYNRNMKGKRFWFNAGKTEEDGKCIRGKVLRTYYAACPGYDADATKNV